MLYFLILIFTFSCSSLKDGITLRHKKLQGQKQSWQKQEKTERVAFGHSPVDAKVELGRECYQTLVALPRKGSAKGLRKVCAKVSLREGCKTEQGRSIFHYQREGSGRSGLRILALSLIHGDEIPSGSVARSWIVRLERINPRNTWRIIPVANPDGLVAKTRTNARMVDINRNFPTQNWNKLAIKLWKQRYQSTWRKYPGQAPASERETRCLMGHINDFVPDFIVSLHTPLGHLDFDGPKIIEHPSYTLLPWRRFGHYPGSLGRYMWRDRGVPVLTIELKDNDALPSLQALDRLQDVSGTLAIRAKKVLNNQ